MPVSVSTGVPTYFRPSLLARLAVNALLMLPITVSAHFGLGVDVKRRDLLEVLAQQNHLQNVTLIRRLNYPSQEG